MNTIQSKLTNLLILMSTIFLTSCGDDFGDVPNCIEDRIKTFKKNFCDEGASVRLYEFQGMDAYVLDLGGCIIDGSSSVFFLKNVKLLDLWVDLLDK